MPIDQPNHQQEDDEFIVAVEAAIVPYIGLPFSSSVANLVETTIANVAASTGTNTSNVSVTANGDQMNVSVTLQPSYPLMTMGTGMDFFSSNLQPYPTMPTFEANSLNAINWSNLIPTSRANANQLSIQDNHGHEAHVNVGEPGLIFKDTNGVISLEEIVDAIKSIQSIQSATTTGAIGVYGMGGTGGQMFGGNGPYSLSNYGTPSPIYQSTASTWQLSSLPSGAESVYLEIEDGHFVMKYTLIGQLKAEARAFLKIPINKILNITEQFASVNVEKESLQAENSQLKFEVNQNQVIIDKLNKYVMQIAGDYSQKQIEITNEFAEQMKDLVTHMNETRKMLGLLGDDLAYWKAKAIAAEKELEERKRSTDDYLILD